MKSLLGFGNFSSRLLNVLSLIVAALAVSLPAQASVFPDKILLEKIKDAKKHNIVFILTDDHRYDAMGFMGHPFMKTPHLDSIAKEGVHLSNAFVTASLCSPSRASILTGLYTHKHRVIDNQRLEQENAVYFAQYLEKQGYDTAYIGKWHMGQHSDHQRPGFGHWVSFAGQGHYFPPNIKWSLNVNGERVKQKGYITDELTDYAIDWMGRDDEHACSLNLPVELMLLYRHDSLIFRDNACVRLERGYVAAERRKRVICSGAFLITQQGCRWICSV